MVEVKSLIYKKKYIYIPSSLLILVLVKFDNYNEAAFYNIDLVPVFPSCIVENCERQHVLLQLGWAVTMH